MKFFILTILLTLSNYAFGQSTNIPYTYTNEAIENNIEGTIYINFTAMPSGHIVDSTVTVLKGLGYGLDEAAADAIRNMPPLGSNSVTRLKKDQPTKYTIPVRFKITDNDRSAYHVRKGRTYLTDNEIEKALVSLNTSLKYNNKNALAYYILFETNKKTGDLDAACKNLKLAKKYNTDYKDKWKSECK